MHAPQDGKPDDTGLVECGVPHRQEGVTQTQDVAHGASVRFVEEIRFAALAVEMRVRAEERRECTYPVPAHEHLRLRVTEEATDVGYAIQSA
jgi:hypothetical protein